MSAALAAEAATPIIELRGVTKRFEKKEDGAARLVRRVRGARMAPAPVVRAVDDVNLVVHGGEVLGLVGESGCGKSTLGRMVAGIMPPSDGQVLFKGRDRAALQGAEARHVRLLVQMIFQDPYGCIG
jgi:peptide/nickel transport system ATP-binding protein